MRESDWQKLRELREVALERFCDRVLREIATFSNNGQCSYHERYLKVYELIHDRDKELANAFNTPRRSIAEQQLAAMHALGLISEDELAEFEEETRRIVLELSAIYS